MRSTPRVTFIIPCFNHGRFVAEAARSALAQRAADVRVIIINDGSSDGSTPAACDACALLSPAVQVIHQPNRGLPAARNAGAAISRTNNWADYLVFLDADDYLEPSFVSRLHRAIESDNAPEVSHAYCQERLVDQASGVWRVPEWDPTLLLITNLHPVTALIRRDCFEAVGGFDESFRSGYEDWDLWLRFAERSWRGVRVREPLFNWRRHSPTTLVMEATKRHADLFAQIVDRHPALYGKDPRRLIELSNTLLRRADANWLDENGDAIFIRDLRARNCELFDELQASTAENARLHAALHALEQRPALRAARLAGRALDGVARLASAPARAIARWTRRAL
ncbi:MAG TPA: glycosyltransferase family A protein [Phycisphaerales bacterium]|nr:glycosyltransferase family A protein [Phycisphaerales bacterium]